MEDRALNEKESLQLISQMIQSSKQNLEVGRGNEFLLWGYTTTILAFAIFVLEWVTRQDFWSFGWLLLFVFWAGMNYFRRSKKPQVVTYTSKAINQVWRVLGYMFIITVIVFFALTYAFQASLTIICMPLSLLYIGIGVSITGIILQERCMIYTPLVAFVIAFYMLGVLAAPNITPDIWWNLYFGIAIILMQIVPGHVLNCKAKKVCSKN